MSSSILESACHYHKQEFARGKAPVFPLPLSCAFSSCGAAGHELCPCSRCCGSYKARPRSSEQREENALQGWGEKMQKAQRAPRPALLAEISLLALGMSAVTGIKANAAAGQPVPRDCSPSASCGIWHSDRRQGKLLSITLTHKLSSADWKWTGRQQLTHTPDFSLMPLPFPGSQLCQSCRGAQSTAFTARRRRLHAFRPGSPLSPNTSKPGPARPHLLPSCWTSLQSVSTLQPPRSWSSPPHSLSSPLSSFIDGNQVSAGSNTALLVESDRGRLHLTRYILQVQAILPCFPSQDAVHTVTERCHNLITPLHSFHPRGTLQNTALSAQNKSPDKKKKQTKTIWKQQEPSSPSVASSFTCLLQGTSAGWPSRTRSIPGVCWQMSELSLPVGFGAWWALILQVQEAPKGSAPLRFHPSHPPGAACAPELLWILP